MNLGSFWRATFWNIAQSMISVKEELAFRIKTSVKSYAKIERAEVHTNLKILDRLSQATGISTAQLLTPFFAVQPSKDNEADQTNQV